MSKWQNDFVLPSGWAKATISEVIQPFQNSDPAKSERDSFHYIDINAIDNTLHRVTEPKFLPTDKAPSRARKMVRSGDVLISLVRPYLKNIAIVPQELDNQWASTAFCICRPHEGIDSRFLYYLYLHNDFLNTIPTYGDSPPSGHDDDLLATSIAIPPEKELSRIVDRIEELFTDLDAGIAALERVKRNLSRYRAAVLHAAVTGRLTEEWRKEHGPPEEPASELLERILEERRKQWEEKTLAGYEAKEKKPPKNWKVRYKEPVPPKPLEEGKPLPPLPQGWSWASLDQLADVTGGITKNTKQAGQPGMRDVAYLRVANVQRGYLDLTEIKFISAKEKDINELRLRQGDVLFTEGGDRDKLGRGWVWEEQIEECVHQNHVFRARPFLSEVNSELISHSGNSYGQVWFRTGGIQSVNLASISLGVIKYFPVPLAPSEEQDEIAFSVNEKLTQIDALESEVSRGLSRANRLRQAILKAAFEGKLVPQDPNDEPASVLLERIREQASKTPKTKRKTRKKSSRKAATT
tara:strand:+ start:49078 stop:50646 length:1569 start_codon:yes stop_codon:yes gene_type:complete